MSSAVVDTEPMTADEIRARLRLAQGRKERAEAAQAKAVAEQRELLAAVRDTPGISMTEAAEILQMSRRGAYKLMDGWSVGG